jgi:hypothetical protein
MKLVCRTLFDCSYTGVTGNYRAGHTPFVDRTGRTIDSVITWHFARNQQRNWETLLQMISLRAQPVIVKYPTQDQDQWNFEFDVESVGVYSSTANANNVDILLAECNNIPMIVNLTESVALDPNLITAGKKQNIWFEYINT